MAYVSGIAALMRGKMPALIAARIQATLLQTSRPDENEVSVVDLCLAVNAAANMQYQNCQRNREVAVKR